MMVVTFIIFIITIIPSPHKACLDNNIAKLKQLDRDIYSDDEIARLGKSIGEGCRGRFTINTRRSDIDFINKNTLTLSI